MLTVCCVLSDGPGGYGPEHVERLMKQVEPHINQPYRFVCLTNNEDVPCERLALVNGWPGWWAKLELFRPGLFKSGSTNRVLYLDLDVEIVGNLDELVEYPSSFTIIKDWNRKGFNSSVMLWDADSGITDHIWRGFTKPVMHQLHGDQNWIERCMPLARTFPQWWCLSYKAHIQATGRIPPTAKIIVYHGKPKPWSMDPA